MTKEVQSQKTAQKVNYTVPENEEITNFDKLVDKILTIYSLKTNPNKFKILFKSLDKDYTMGKDLLLKNKSLRNSTNLSLNLFENEANINPIYASSYKMSYKNKDAKFYRIYESLKLIYGNKTNMDQARYWLCISEYIENIIKNKGNKKTVDNTKKKI